MALLRTVLALLAAFALAWSAIVFVSSPITFSIARLKFSASDPLRPLAAAAAAALVYAWVSGWRRTGQDLARLLGRLGPAQLAALLALAIVTVSFAWNSWAAGGSDEYVYLTQADQWLRGSLTIQVPIAADVPWPDALATFTPFGYHAAPSGTGIVPMVGPGLPIIMALLKAAAGHAAAFWVAPLTSGLLIWAMFLIGRRLGSDALGLGAAWLVATSPTVLLMSRSMMSDVPVTAFWALSIGCLLGASAWSATAAGLLAAVAVMVRPNLVPLAAVLAVWCAWREWVRPGGRLTRVLWFSAAVIPGCLGVAWFNHYEYGSALASGYGKLTGLFALAHVPVNLAQYAGWLTQTETPMVWVGFVALFVPIRRVWPTAIARHATGLLLAVVVVTLAIYVAYTPFDAWWYLRFLLPAFPAFSLGLAAVMVCGVSRHGRWLRIGAAAGLVMIGTLGVTTAIRLGVYPRGEGERRYATIAGIVSGATEPSAVIITQQHAGALRYYGGRLTLRFDALDPAWLDRAVAWLGAHGRHVYVLLEDWERPNFEHRFGNASAIGRLELDPVLVYSAAQIPGMVFLYDPLRPVGPTLRPPPIRNPRPRCPPPAPPVPLTLAPHQP
jgi:4-amino-4-deoxy-L-arabinose transferase-like glycosyltransferase